MDFDLILMDFDLTFDLIFDGKYTELFDELVSKDFLEFTDLKPYHERLEFAKKKTQFNEAISVAHGKVNRKNL